MGVLVICVLVFTVFLCCFVHVYLFIRFMFLFNFVSYVFPDRLCGLVVRVSGYRYRGLGFDSPHYQIF